MGNELVPVPSSTKEFREYMEGMLLYSMRDKKFNVTAWKAIMGAYFPKEYGKPTSVGKAIQNNFFENSLRAINGQE